MTDHLTTGALERIDPTGLVPAGSTADGGATVNEAALERWIADFEAHRAVWGEMLTANVERIQAGSASFHWLSTEGSNWGTKVQPSSRGLTMNDINRPAVYGDQPAVATWRNFAPRGSVREPYAGRMPVIEGYDQLLRDEVWASNVGTLYEEAKVRQWNATRDIPWHEVGALPEDLEKATCQLATVLTEVEFVAGDFPARWMWRIPPDFFEAKNFLATQILDEARHMEVFRKRALAGGGGLLHASPASEWALKSILEAPTHTMGTFLLNLLGEGLVLSIFRSGEFIARTPADKEIFRLCMQDEARHVSYGTLELFNHLEHHPDRAAAIEQLHRFADLGEQIILTALTDPTLVEPIAVLMGGGVDHFDDGMAGIEILWSVIVEEYLQRCERAGFPRRERCTLPLEMARAA